VKLITLNSFNKQKIISVKFNDLLLLQMYQLVVRAAVHQNRVRMEVTVMRDGASMISIVIVQTQSMLADYVI